MTLWGEDWEYDWSYFPSPGAKGLQERVQEEIKKALDDLYYRKENDAAAAFDALLADDLTHREITNAVTRFDLVQKGSGKTVRQGDVHGLADDLKAIYEKVLKLEHRLAEQRINLDGTPGLPDISEIARRGSDAYQAIYDLAQLADSMRRAVIAEHGKDKGSNAISERLAGDPLDHLAHALSGPWKRHGNGLEGRALTNFMHVLRAVHEAETKEQDIPERAEKRIKKNLPSGTPPPWKK